MDIKEFITLIGYNPTDRAIIVVKELIEKYNSDEFKLMIYVSVDKTSGKLDFQFSNVLSLDICSNTKDGNFGEWIDIEKDVANGILEDVDLGSHDPIKIRDD